MLTQEVKPSDVPAQSNHSKQNDYRVRLSLRRGKNFVPAAQLLEGSGGELDLSPHPTPQEMRTNAFKKGHSHVALW